MTDPLAGPRLRFWRRVWRRVAPYVEMKLPQVVLVYRHDLSEIRPPDLAPGCTIELLEEARLPLLNQVWSVDAKEMTDRMARGDRCYGGFVDGRFAHYSWAQTAGWHRLTGSGRRYAVQPGELWIYHCRTADWARGRGLYPSALETIMADHRRQGGKRCWIYTTEENGVSQRGILRVGFTLDRSLRALRLGVLCVPLS